MTDPPVGLAGWAPDTSAAGGQWDSLPETVRELAARLAVSTLWALSGRQFGTVDVTLAPYLAPVAVDRYGVGRSLPGGLRLNSAAGYATGGYGACFPARAFRLPGPVDSVTEVVISGEVLPASSWVCDPDGTLVRTDGSSWPVAQDVYAPVWTVRYVRGTPAPPDANLAAGLYAFELARGMTGDPACKLPSRTRDVTRQGISLTLLTPEDLAKGGGTGIKQVDDWLRSVNPGRQQEMSSLWVPGASRHRVIAVRA
jgi:hypothetical protein